MPDPLQQTLVDLAVRYPSASRVLRSHGLDFWSRGRRTVAEACQESGIDPWTVLDEIARENRESGPGLDWCRRPLSELVHHLEGLEHPRLRLALRDLVGIAELLHPSVQQRTSRDELLGWLTELSLDMTAHMQKEEEILYPLILEGQAARASESIHTMEMEHQDQVELITRVRSAAGGTRKASGRFQREWERFGESLRSLEVLLTDHIHLENNILFPRGFFEGRRS